MERHTLTVTAICTFYFLFKHTHSIYYVPGSGQSAYQVYTRYCSHEYHTHTQVHNVTQTKETLLTLTLLFMKKEKHKSAHDPLNGSGLVNGKKPDHGWARLDLFRGSRLHLAHMFSSGLQLRSLPEYDRTQGKGSSQCCHRPSF